MSPPPDDDRTMVGGMPPDDDDDPPASSPAAKPQQAAASATKPAPTVKKAPQEDIKSIPSAAALQSLSLDDKKTASGRSSLPWVLLVLAVGGMGGYQYYLKTQKPTGADPGLPPQPTPAAQPGGKAAGPVGIKIETIRPIKNERGQLRAAGYIAARTPIVVGATVPGQIQRLLVNEGDKVKRNQIIAQLDDRLAQSEQILALAKRRDAARSLSRLKSLLDANSATVTDYERAQGQLEIAEAEVKMINQRIELAKIRSPIDGTILEELAHPGQVITGSEGIVKMADFSKLVAEIDVNEGDLTKVHLNQNVTVTSEAFGEQVFQGVVKEISEQADRAKGTVIVRVSMQVPANTLRPGMSVKATFSIAADEKPRIVIPRSAVDKENVWLVGDDGTVSQRQVSTQPAGPLSVEILSGLSEGERVVVHGNAGLKPGQKVP